ncbi:MAG: hypothetical protein GY798_11380 [Hyphomicrobiales bacterium]|nr:hypothetical protein [Hyphomicrobiales bacterium]
MVRFDDNPLNEWVAPWLTSVRVPYDAYGTPWSRYSTR